MYTLTEIKNKIGIKTIPRKTVSTRSIQKNVYTLLLPVFQNKNNIIRQ